MKQVHSGDHDVASDLLALMGWGRRQTRAGASPSDECRSSKPTRDRRECGAHSPQRQKSPPYYPLGRHV